MTTCLKGDSVQDQPCSSIGQVYCANPILVVIVLHAERHSAIHNIILMDMHQWPICAGLNPWWLIS